MATTTCDPNAMEPGGREPVSPEHALKLVRLRLALTLAATAILPMAVGLPLAGALTRGPSGTGTIHLAVVAAAALSLLALIAWMARQVLAPAAELAASRARLRQAYDDVREVALVDALTGLGNHRAFQEAFDSAVEEARRYRHQVSLVLLDLDEFKLINDAQGHAAGDDVLAEAGRLIKRGIRRADRAFRIGGDEFALLLPHTDADGAAQLSRRLLASSLEVRPEARYARPISFCAGVATFPTHALTHEQLQAQADAAMYRGKRSGRTAVTIVDPALDGQQVDEQKRTALSAAVAKVIADRALRPVYQPLVDVQSGHVLGYEGLIRPTPGSAFSNPASLFAAAEIGGRVVELDLACLTMVLDGARAIGDPLLLSINLSPRTLETPEFGAPRLLAMLGRVGFPPERVILELTERDIINDIPRVVAVLERCRAAGIRIAADDVGAGNAGLRLLSQFRFDVVKIDLSLVQAGTGQETVRTVLRSLVDLASRWGALVVAEGVETPAQLAMARDLRIDAVQGYLLARPGDRLDIAHVDVDALLRPPAPPPSDDPYARLGLEAPIPWAPAPAALSRPGLAT
jgi:diguanylate cyclase (GGDEF)-like protein